MRRDKLKTVPNILIDLAGLLGTKIENRKLEIPEEFGKGYCSGYIFNQNIRMVVSNYELKEDILIVNPEMNAPGRMIFFKFQNIFPNTHHLSAKERIKIIPSVLIGTSRVNTEDVISIHSNTSTITIDVKADYLNELFASSEKSPVLQSLLSNNQPLLFEQLIYPSLMQIVNEILNEKIDETFELFFLRIKAEELICRLLMELEKREEKYVFALDSRDIQVIYKVKEQILQHLEIPPVINELASYANMSPTKLKRLFRQIFGNSIFSYYQGYRMKEAARLLKEESLSVSEVGYQLGFSNLSHFSKVFNDHIGMKPKQYSRS